MDESMYKYFGPVVQTGSSMFKSEETMRKLIEHEIKERRAKKAEPSNSSLITIEEEADGRSLEEMIQMLNKIYESVDVKELDLLVYRRGGLQNEPEAENSHDLGKFRIFNYSNRVCDFYTPDSQEKVEIASGVLNADEFGKLWKPENNTSPLRPYWAVLVFQSHLKFKVENEGEVERGYERVQDFFLKSVEIMGEFAEKAIENGAVEDFRISAI